MINGSMNYSSHDQGLVMIYTALGVVHLIIVVVPTLILTAVVLYYLWKQMKTSGLKPVSLLFFFLPIWCMLGPLTYGILWDISLITAVPVFGNCTSKHPVHVIQYLLQFGIGMALSITIATIAVVQFLVLQCGKFITVKKVIAAYAIMVILCFGFSCIFFNGGYTEIRGSHCKAFPKSGLINVVIWMAVAYVAPIVLTLVFSVLTCLKVKKDVVDENNSVIKSVVALSTFNIFAYVILRVGSLAVYFTVVAISPTINVIYLWTTISRYIGELNYPVAAFSIVVVHSGMRKMVASFVRTSMCSTRVTRASADTALDSTESKFGSKQY